MRVAVTGAGGFVGRALCLRLAQDGHAVRAITRRVTAFPAGIDNVAAGDLLTAEKPSLVAGCDVLVNCAARVHVLHREDANTAERMFQAHNAQLPVVLAQAAQAQGVGRMVQLSSVAAIASASGSGTIIDDDTPPEPATPYGRAKLAADRELAALAANGLTIVSLRPPAVYGPGVGAFFGRLLQTARLGLPLPVGRIDNVRSFIFLDNLVDAIACAMQRPVSGSFVVTDSPPLATAALYRRLLALSGHPDRTWRWPAAAVHAAARLVLRDRAASLLGDAAFSGDRFAREFGWTAPFTMDEGLRATVKGGR